MSTASDYFGAMVREYDSLIRRTVPRYDEMIERLLHYQRPGARRVLELGCGTGNLTRGLLERQPSAEVVAVDASPQMVEVTLRSLGRPPRLRGCESRFEELPRDLGRFDRIVSCISLHHVEHKAPLYERLFALLEPGGQLIFADQLRGVDDEVHQLNWDAWIAFSQEPGGTSPEELEGLVEHAHEHDHYTPLQEHFALLEESGFERLDCVWRNWIWGILTARRP